MCKRCFLSKSMGIRYGVMIVMNGRGVVIGRLCKAVLLRQTCGAKCVACSVSGRLMLAGCVIRCHYALLC